MLNKYRKTIFIPKIIIRKCFVLIIYKILDYNFLLCFILLQKNNFINIHNKKFKKIAHNVLYTLLISPNIHPLADNTILTPPPSPHKHSIGTSASFYINPYLLY
jgi:hypothetical protein